MINTEKTHDKVWVVNDQISIPTYCFGLAWLLVDMRETEKYGYYHATNEGCIFLAMTFVVNFISSMLSRPR